MDMIGVATALTAGMTGAGVGGSLVWRIVGSRAAARHARLVSAAREQIVASTQNLRTVNARLQAELEKERATARQSRLALVAEQRASVTRLEGQLRFAYAEIDRLNSRLPEGSSARALAEPADAHGFALTRPFER